MFVHVTDVCQRRNEEMVNIEYCTRKMAQEETARFRIATACLSRFYFCILLLTLSCAVCVLRCLVHISWGGSGCTRSHYRIQLAAKLACGMCVIVPSCVDGNVLMTIVTMGGICDGLSEK